MQGSTLILSPFVFQTGHRK